MLFDWEPFFSFFFFGLASPVYPSTEFDWTVSECDNDEESGCLKLCKHAVEGSFYLLTWSKQSKHLGVKNSPKTICMHSSKLCFQMFSVVFGKSASDLCRLQSLMLNCALGALCCPLDH